MPIRHLTGGLLLILAMHSAAPALAQNAATTIAGAVVARDSGKPIAGAVVTIEGSSLTATTSALGRFEITGAPTGRVAVAVKAPGYLAARLSDVQAGSGDAPALTVELDPTPNFLERIQVTATKTPLSIGDVPAQATIVTRSEIDRRGDQELVQAIANVPGLIVSGQAGSFDSVMLRGLPRDGNEFTSTLLLIDGVPQTDSRNSARVVNLPINDASSIEVVRGPNSALYGRTAIGGAVNVRTADPTPSQQVRFDMTGGQYGMLKGMAAASGPLARWGGYYVSLGSERSHGYYKKDTDFAIEEIAAFAKLTFVPDQRSFGSISVNRVLSDNSTPTAVPIVEGRFLSDIDPAFDRLTNLNVPGTNYHQAEGRATLNYTRQLAPWVTATEVFGYRAVQYKFIDDGDVIGSPFDLAAQTFTMYPFEQETNEDILYQELRVELTPQTGAVRNSVTLGGSYEHTSGFSSGNLIFTDADTLGWPINYVTPVIPPKSDWQFERFGGRDYNVGNLGLFVQYIVEPARRWSVTAAGRYDRIGIDSTQTLAAGRPRLEDSFQAFSPKLATTFRVLGAGRQGGPSLNLFATYSEAFLPPRRPNDLAGTTIDIDLEPEDIRNYEGGLKGSVLGGRLSLEASVFRMRRDGIITTVRQGPLFLPTNAGKHEYKGVETGASYLLSPRLSFYANASFYRNRFGTFVARDTELTGNRLPISPDRVINWGVSVTPTASVDAVLNVKHVGDVFVDQINSFKFDPYTLVDASASWRRGPVRFTLSAHNLLDSKYYWNGDTSLGESADPGRPRQVLLTTSLLFR